jgi:hypothetical protein
MKASAKDAMSGMTKRMRRTTPNLNLQKHSAAE